jgi:hypothetical protein
MGRWTQYDEVRQVVLEDGFDDFRLASQDSYRLPEGITRIGYDADTSQYTFVDEEGIVYQGAPGAKYGLLTPVTAHHPQTYETSG